MREQRIALILLFVICFTLVSFPNVHIVEANTFTIPYPSPAFFIKGDGSVDPSTAPIHRDGDVYTFTDDIIGYTIIVQKDNIILDGGGYTLKGYGSEGNFTLNGYEAPTGIFIMQHNGVTVRNMKISGFSYGILITPHPLLYLACTNNVLENNLVTDNYYGVFMDSSWYTVLRNNHMKNNICNFYVSDFIRFSPPPLDLFVNDIDSSNTVDGKPIIYWVNEQDKTVPSNAGYIALVKCTNMTVQNLNLSDTGQGILLISTTNSLITKNYVSHVDCGIFTHNSINLVITKNNLENNYDGIRLLRESNENMIYENRIAENSNGIRIEHGVNNSIVGNWIAENKGVGLGLTYSHNNVIYHNSFLHNREVGGLQVGFLSEEGIPSGNMWNNGTIGNYWSDYNGTDSDGDGICDTQFHINNDNIDLYPLMEPVEILGVPSNYVIPEFPSWLILPLVLTIILFSLVVKRKLCARKN